MVLEEVFVRFPRIAVAIVLASNAHLTAGSPSGLRSRNLNSTISGLVVCPAPNFGCKLAANWLQSGFGHGVGHSIFV